MQQEITSNKICL